MSVLRTMTTVTTITNVPKREESRAKRHFQQIAINEVRRWKCKYCAKNYGLNTSTTSLWKHLERTHPDKLTAEDTKQKSGNERHHCTVKNELETDWPSGNTAADALHVHRQEFDAIDDVQISQLNATEEIPKLPTPLSPQEDPSPAKSTTDKRKHSLQPDCIEEDNHGKVRSAGSPDDASWTPGSDSDDPCRLRLVKRLATSTGNDVATHSQPHQAAAADSGYGFADLLTDVVSMRPSELEQFQDILLQHAILQRWSVGGEPESRILSRQRDRVVQTALDECGWKFDMNLYPVSLFGRQHLVLDLVYRKLSGEHRACFLDCVELPDEYPMELLSIVVFRKLCEFRVEDKLWQLFVGNSRLRHLADILRNIFRENSLGESLQCETVDFSLQVFTVKQDTHDVTTIEFLANLKECRNELDKLQKLLGWIKNDNQQLHESSWDDFTTGQACNSIDWELPDISDGALQQVAPSDCLYPAIRQDGIASSRTVSTHRPDDNLVTITVLKTSEQMQLLRHKLRPFRQEVQHIRRWVAEHLFIAHHMCSYCYYVCNEVNECRNASSAARFYLSDLLQQLSGRHQLASDLAGSNTYVAGVHKTVARLRERLYDLVFRDHQLDGLLDEWNGILAGWQDMVEQYRRLREEVCHHVMASDAETSTFARNFEKASRYVPAGVSEERWMKYVHWKIWRDFDR